MCPSAAHHPGSQHPLTALVKPNHPLVKLAQALDWSEFEQALTTSTPETGRPALPTRLMVGLHYLKAMYHESDESVIENSHWQYFCGEQFFQHDFPCHPTSLVKWRKRVGVDGIERLLIQQSRYAAARQPKRAQKYTKQLRT